jgi:iron-sulfur cluster repair protein YtfE (RIC family)
MQILDLDQPLDELLRKAPEILLLLRRLEVPEGTDLTLGQAAGSVGLGPVDLARAWEELARELGRLDEEELKGFDIPELVGHIFFIHHHYLEKEIPRLEALLGRAILEDGEAHPELLELQHPLREFCEVTFFHMREEEGVLFPFFLFLALPENRASLSLGERENLVRIFEMENEQLHGALESLRSRTRNYHVPPDAGEAYRELGAALTRMEFELRRHARVENHLLLPKVLEAQSGPPLPEKDPLLHFKE